MKIALLTDIRGIFARLGPKEAADQIDEGPGRPRDGPRLLTREIIDELVRLEERPWGAWGKAQKPLTDVGLSKLLRPYGIRSGTVRGDNDVTGKGYYLRSFEDAFSRYLPLPGVSTRHTVTSPENTGVSKDFEPVTGSNLLRVENPRNAYNSLACDGVTGSNPENGGTEIERAPEKTAGDRSGDWRRI